MDSILKGTILLVEDNQELNTVNCRAMTLRGYKTAAAESLAEARAYLKGHRPDVILLDVMLPDGDGFAFCREIRQQTDAHIIFLTARTAYKDLMQGLSDGGDDYIRKPFHPGELLGRIEAVMRRRTMDKNGASPNIIIRGTLKLNITAAQAFLGTSDMLLSQKEFSLLLFLVQNEGKTFTKETLYQKVWGQPMAEDSRAVYVAISRLKKKLETVPGVYLESKRQEGYCLASK